MKKEQIRHLPVDDAGRWLGLITDRDARSAIFAPALIEHLPVSAQQRARGVAGALEELRVRHAMTWDVVTTPPETTLEHAARVMFYGPLGSVPVFDGNEAGGHPHWARPAESHVPPHARAALEVEGFLW